MVENTLVTQTLLLAAYVAMTATVGLASPLPQSANPRSDAQAQVEFGIKVAQKKLWREAAYRFQKAVEIDPTYAAAWNNLAIAYEEQGRLGDANKAYKKALELDPENVLIRQNYDLFNENYVRLSQRNRR